MQRCFPCFVEGISKEITHTYAHSGLRRSEKEKKILYCDIMCPMSTTFAICKGMIFFWKKFHFSLGLYYIDIYIYILAYIRSHKAKHTAVAHTRMYACTQEHAAHPFQQAVFVLCWGYLKETTHTLTHTHAYTLAPSLAYTYWHIRSTWRNHVHTRTHSHPHLLITLTRTRNTSFSAQSVFRALLMVS